ncbi:MAG: hypothetical protein KDJ69_06315 [Nitratireductor sp.]|nr:hypothetical protein [Nitratireductor sp.]
MKFATLTTSVFVLSATLMAGAASAQASNLVATSGAKTCWINGQQLFNCHYVEQRQYKLLPPTFDPNDIRKEVGNEGGSNEKGDRGGRGSRKP